MTKLSKNLLIMFSALAITSLSTPRLQAQETFAATDSITLKGVTISAQPPSDLTAEDLQPYNELTDADKAEFRAHRRYFLQGIIKIFSWSKLVFGTGSITKDKIFEIPVHGAELMRKSYGESPSLHPLDLGLFPNEIVAPKEIPKTISERGTAMLQAITDGIDHRLWQSAPILAHSQEFGLNAIYGRSAGLVFGKKGLSAQLDMGIGLGYEKSTRTVYFDIFGDLEWFKNNLMKMPDFIAKKIPEKWRDKFIYLPYPYYSRTYRGDVYFASRQDSSAKPFFKGEIAYPPGYGNFVRSPGFVAIGFPVSVGFPTTPFDGFNAYNDYFVRLNLLTVAVQPLQKGWVRLDLPAAKIVVAPLMYIKSKIDKLRGAKPAARCEGLF